MIALSVIAAVLALTAAVDEEQAPAFLNINVGLVRVTPTRPGTDQPWTPGSRP